MILMRRGDVQPIMRQGVANVRALEHEDGSPENPLHQLSHALRLDQPDVGPQAVKGVVIDCVEARTRPDRFRRPRCYDSLLLQHSKKITFDLQNLSKIEDLPE